MNLFLGLLWLAGAVALFAYEAATGKTPYRIRGMESVSTAWILLLLAAYNFVRWYSYRMSKANEESLRIISEARVRQSRLHERPEEWDPTLDFTDKSSSAAGPRSPTEPPATNN